MFIRKSNSCLFLRYPDETQISVKPNETKIKNSLTSTLHFSTAGTLCVWGSGSRSALNITLMLVTVIYVNTQTTIQDLCKHCCGFCDCKIVNDDSTGIKWVLKQYKSIKANVNVECKKYNI